MSLLNKKLQRKTRLEEGCVYECVQVHNEHVCLGFICESMGKCGPYYGFILPAGLNFKDTI